MLNTLLRLVVESSMIPLQLLQFPSSPFFGSLKRSPVCQSSGINLYSSQMLLKISVKTHEISGSPAFNISIHIPSSIGVLPFFKVLIAPPISSGVGGSTLTLISYKTSGIVVIETKSVLLAN